MALTRVHLANPWDTRSGTFTARLEASHPLGGVTPSGGS